VSETHTSQALRARARELLARYADALIQGEESSAIGPGSATEIVVSLLHKCLALEADATYVRLLDHFGMQLQREYHLQQVEALFAAVLRREILSDAQRVAFTDLRVRILIQLGERELAQAALDEVRPATSPPALRARVCNRQGYLYAIYNRYAEAEQTYRAGIAAAVAGRDMNTLAILHSNYGDLFFQKSDFAQAIEQYEKALEIAKPRGLSFACALAEGGLGMALDQLDQYEAAVRHHEMARACYAEAGDAFGTIRIDLNLSYNALQRGAYEQVKELAARALAQARELGDLHRMAFAHQRLGEAFLGAEDYVLACEHFIMALELRRQLGKPLFIERTLESLHELLVAIRDDADMPPEQRATLSARCQRVLGTTPDLPALPPA
jgi:tetratricopeptide (TPR) repeat protein